MVSDRDASRVNSVAQRTFEFADATGEDSPGTTSVVLATPFRDRNLFSFEFSDLDIASAQFAKPDERSCSGESGDGCRELVHVSCEDWAQQSQSRLIED